MQQRWYEVVFETLERNPVKRTVKVRSSNSVYASDIVYRQFGGRKKIKVKSAKKARDSE